VRRRQVKAVRHASGAIRHKLSAVPLIRIDDAGDERLGDYRGVSDADLAARNGLFIAEGRLVVRRLLAASRFPTRSVLVTEPALKALADVLDPIPTLPVFVVPQSVMNGVTGFNIHRGCLAIGERPTPARWPDVVDQLPTPNAQPPIVAVLERVANADNVGGVFRSAAAFGAGAVLLDPVSTDPLYRKAIRTSMGAALQVPFARAEPWPGALLELRRLGFAVIAMTPAPAAPVLRDVVRGVAGRRVAIVLGHEGEGLTPEALAACELQARIPISGHIDSLNVVAAAAIALYEFAGSATRNPAYESSRRT
jgi:tRNA G18 (ribose-2'-O)-methylase SpoU